MAGTPLSSSSTTLPRGARAILFALLALLYLPGLGSRGLSSAQEARTGIVARTMLDSGDWVRPRLPGDEANQKPAMLYWCVAITASIRGMDEVSVRLPSALAALGTLGLLLLGTRRREGALAAILLGTTPFFHHLGRTGRVDMLLCFFVTAAMLALPRAQDRDRDPPARRGAFALVGGLALGLAILTKGLVGPAIVGGALVVHAILDREPRRLLRPSMLVAALVALAVATPWFVAVGRATDGAFLRDFFGADHFRRALGSEDEDGHPLWYYLGVLPLRTLPWCLLAVVVGRRARGDRNEERGTARGRWAWAGFGFVFLSLISYKRADYLLPLFPPLALLLGAALVRAASVDGAPRRLELARRSLWTGTAVLSLAVLASAGLRAGGQWTELLDAAGARQMLHRKDVANLRLIGEHIGGIAILLAVAAASAFTVLSMLRRGLRERALLFAAGAVSVFLVAKALWFEPAADARVSLRDFCQEVTHHTQAEPVSVLELRHHELHYYLGHRPDELRLEDLQAGPRPRWLIVSAEDFEQWPWSRSREWAVVQQTAPGHARPLALLRREP